MYNSTKLTILQQKVAVLCISGFYDEYFWFQYVNRSWFSEIWWQKKSFFAIMWNLLFYKLKWQISGREVAIIQDTKVVILGHKSCYFVRVLILQLTAIVFVKKVAVFIHFWILQQSLVSFYIFWICIGISDDV